MTATHAAQGVNGLASVKRELLCVPRTTDALPATGAALQESHRFPSASEKADGD